MKPKTAAQISAAGKAPSQVAGPSTPTQGRPDMAPAKKNTSPPPPKAKPSTGGPRKPGPRSGSGVWGLVLRLGFLFSIIMFLSCAMAPNYLTTRVKGEDVQVNELDVLVGTSVPIESWNATVDAGWALFKSKFNGPAPENLAESFAGKIARGEWVGLVLIEPDGELKVTAKDGSKQAVEEWLEYQHELQEENRALRSFLEEVKLSREAKTLYLEIDLTINTLFVKIGEATIYKFPIVTGRGFTPAESGKNRRFATPRGIHSVISKELNPIWRPPAWHWAEIGASPPGHSVGVRGVLGKFRLNLGDGYGIHGTSSGSIGHAGKYSHGCIRMNAKDLAIVYQLCDIGTKVVIF